MVKCAFKSSDRARAKHVLSSVEDFRLQPETKKTLLQENTAERAVWRFSSPAVLLKSEEKNILERERRERMRLEMKSIFNVSLLS